MLSQRAAVYIFLLSFVSTWNIGISSELDDNGVLIDGNNENPPVGNLRHGATFMDQKTSLLEKKVSDASTFGSEGEDDDEESKSGIDADDPDNDPESTESFNDEMVEDLQSACRTQCHNDLVCGDLCPYCRDGVCQKAPTCNEQCRGTGPGNCDPNRNCLDCVRGRCQNRSVCGGKRCNDSSVCNQSGCSGYVCVFSNDGGRCQDGVCGDKSCLNSSECNELGCSGYQCVPVSGGGRRCKLSSQLPTCDQQCFGTGAGDCSLFGSCQSCVNGRCEQGGSNCNRGCRFYLDPSCNQFGCAGYQCLFFNGRHSCTPPNRPTCGQGCFGTGAGNCDPFGRCQNCVNGRCEPSSSNCNQNCLGPFGPSNLYCNQSGCSGYQCVPVNRSYFCRR